MTVHGVIPAEWTPIAREKQGRWIDLFDAPMTLSAAVALFEAGYILMAQRRAEPKGDSPAPMEIVVKGRQR